MLGLRTIADDYLLAVYISNFSDVLLLGRVRVCNFECRVKLCFDTPAANPANVGTSDKGPALVIEVSTEMLAVLSHLFIESVVAIEFGVVLATTCSLLIDVSNAEFGITH